MFQFPPFASCNSLQDVKLMLDGLSHSDIRGSKVICTSPQLFAAYHVLHRLQEPRHPPYALSYFRLCPGGQRMLHRRTLSILLAVY